MEIGHKCVLLSLTLCISSASSVPECGVKKSSTRIVGGRDSGGYHYPWFGLLVLKENEDFPVCAGSLITGHHILTAAHCFNIKPSTPKDKLYDVLLGVYDRCDHNESMRQKFEVSQVDIHEEYNNQNKFHDIAIMTLATPAYFTVICLPFPGVADVTEPAVLVGFGVTKEGGNKAPCHMMEADITKYSKTDCRHSDLPEGDLNEPTIFCGGKIDGGIDSCQGDSGGPLQILTSSGKYVIAGIVSYGYGCANPGLPGLYTNVGSYLYWIKNKISDNKQLVPSKHVRFYNRPRTTINTAAHNYPTVPVLLFPNDGFQPGSSETNNGKLIERSNTASGNSGRGRISFRSDGNFTTKTSTITFPKERK